MLEFAQGFGVERSKTADVPQTERHRQSERQKEPETPTPDIPENGCPNDPEQVRKAQDAMEDPHTAHDHSQSVLPEERGGLDERQSAEHDRSDSRGASGWESAFDLIRQTGLGSR